MLAAVLLALAVAPAGAPLDYYAELGVDRTSSDEDIKRSFKRAALLYHPDRQPAGASPAARREAEVRFKRVAEAYEVLGSPAKRQKYDAQRSGIVFPGAADQSAAGAGRAYAADVIITCTLQELFRGAVKYAQLPGELGLMIAVPLRPEWPDGHTIEAFANDGRAIRVRIAVRGHADFRRDGDDLRAARVVWRRLAARGRPVRIRGIDGRLHTIRMPRGGGWRATTLKVRRAGMWAPHGFRGDMYVRIALGDWKEALGAQLVRVTRLRWFETSVKALIILANGRAVQRAVFAVLAALLRPLAGPGARQVPSRARSRRGKVR
mmetsp:Transcript_3021/g.9925  ORF Transcript_3021/g.9925 Transcript_3021/m.9925 type:complete len:321 (-) Transcript_3021:139-1101(-)